MYRPLETKQALRISVRRQESKDFFENLGGKVTQIVDRNVALIEPQLCMCNTARVGEKGRVQEAYTHLGRGTKWRVAAILLLKSRVMYQYKGVIQGSNHGGAGGARGVAPWRPPDAQWVYRETPLQATRPTSGRNWLPDGG